MRLLEVETIKVNGKSKERLSVLWEGAEKFAKMAEFTFRRGYHKEQIEKRGDDICLIVS